MNVATIAATIAPQTPYAELAPRPQLVLRRTSSHTRKPVPTLESLDLGDVVQTRRHSIDSPALVPPAPTRYRLSMVPSVASEHATVEATTTPVTPVNTRNENSARRGSNTLLLDVPVRRPNAAKRLWALVVRTFTRKVAS